MKTKTTLATLSLLVLTLYSAFGSQRSAAPAITTGGLLNGAGWHRLDSIQQSMYLRGVIDSSTFLSWAAGKPSDLMQMKWDCKCDLLQIASGIEAIYERDASYRQVPVQLVLPVFLEKAVGKLDELHLAQTMAENIAIANSLATADKNSRH